MAHTFSQIRTLRKAAKDKVKTQLGIQGHSMEGTRLLKEWLQPGVIGISTFGRIDRWTETFITLKPTPRNSRSPTPELGSLSPARDRPNTSRRLYGSCVKAVTSRMVLCQAVQTFTGWLLSLDSMTTGLGTTLNVESII